MFNENELLPLSNKASGVKAMAAFKGQKAIGIHVVQQDEHDKVLLITDKGCVRVFDTKYGYVTPRLGKVQQAFPCFKSDVHKLVSVIKANVLDEKMNAILYDQAFEPINCSFEDFRPTDLSKYAKRNIDGVHAKTRIKLVFTYNVEVLNDDIKSQPIVIKKTEEKLHDKGDILSQDDLTNLGEVYAGSPEKDILKLQKCLFALGYLGTYEPGIFDDNTRAGLQACMAAMDEPMHGVCSAEFMSQIGTACKAYIDAYFTEDTQITDALAYLKNA
jgi:hypothetical protein